MEQFDLMKYLAHPERKIVTRDGRSVRIICTDRKSEFFPIVALVKTVDDQELCRPYTADGLHYISDGESDIDLFFADGEERFFPDRLSALREDSLRSMIDWLDDSLAALRSL